MNDLSSLLSKTTFGLVMLCWLVFAATFLVRRREPAGQQRQRSRPALYGLVLQAIGFALVWTLRRPIGEPFVRAPLIIEIVVDVVAIAVAVGAVWLVMAAVKSLGRQWSVEARLVEGHTLVTAGPTMWCATQSTQAFSH